MKRQDTFFASSPIHYFKKTLPRSRHKDFALRRNPGQKYGYKSCQRQKCAKLIDTFNADPICHPSEDRAKDCEDHAAVRFAADFRNALRCMLFYSRKKKLQDGRIVRLAKTNGQIDLRRQTAKGASGD
jgi:hypothetical protein